MKCKNHPKIKAVGQCSECGVTLCEACNSSEDTSSFMCESCAMLSTFSAMTQRKKEVDEKRTNKKLKDSGKDQKRRTTILITAVAIASVIVIIQLAWYFSLSTPDMEAFDPKEDYFSSTMIINDAIVKYRGDHDGKVPDSLEDLLGEYLPEGDTWKKSLSNYTYKKITPYKYELEPPLTEDSIVPDITISDESITIFGIEYARD